jgi:hypothetical protein
MKKEPTDWDKAYVDVSLDTSSEDKTVHPLWEIIGMVLGMLFLSWLGAWIAEGLT